MKALSKLSIKLNKFIMNNVVGVSVHKGEPEKQ